MAKRKQTPVKEAVAEVVTPEDAAPVEKTASETYVEILRWLDENSAELTQARADFDAAQALRTEVGNRLHGLEARRVGLQNTRERAERTLVGEGTDPAAVAAEYEASK